MQRHFQDRCYSDFLLVCGTSFAHPRSPLINSIQRVMHSVLTNGTVSITVRALLALFGNLLLLVCAYLAERRHDSRRLCASQSCLRFGGRGFVGTFRRGRRWQTPASAGD